MRRLTELHEDPLSKRDAHKERQRCPTCRRFGMFVFIEIRSLPVHSNLLWSGREAAVRAPRGDIQLGFCEACGLIYNVAFDDACLEYTQRYENSLHFSPKFQEYAQALAARLIETYQLRGKEIIEIGCGKGDFLSMLCEAGGNTGLGVDPSCDEATEGETPSASISFVRDFSSSTIAFRSADLICCRHTLEHIRDPRAFLLSVRRAMHHRMGTAVFFEVPNALFILRDLSIWDIIYEHCSYFSAASLTRIFEKTGFAVRKVYPAFRGQFLSLEAFPRPTTHRENVNSDDQVASLAQLVLAFGENYRNKVRTWNDRLRRWQGTGTRLVLWGAGSKGTTFLNCVEASGQIEYVVDINPRKHGMYVAGTGQQIISPDVLPAYRPDVVLVMNPNYREEIRHLVSRMRLAARLVSV